MRFYMSVEDKKQCGLNKHPLACSCRLASPQHLLCPAIPVNLKNNDGKIHIWRCQAFQLRGVGIRPGSSQGTKCP